MHELSIVMSIVDMAEQTAKEHKVCHFDIIELEIGQLAGVGLHALEFVWDSGVKGSVLERTERKIQFIPGKGKCQECQTAFDMENIYDLCPNCQGYIKNIIGGKELRIKSLIIN